MCVFCDIVAGRGEAEIVLEDECCIGFLDIRPLFPGHTLLIPRDHVETLGDLPDGLIEPLFSNARLLAQVMETELDAEGSFVAMNNKVSQSVPHLHVHVVPRRRKDGLRGFFWPRHRYSPPEEMARVAEAIRAGVAATAR
jgi:histidine triad (HIT) family protein